MPKVLKQEDCWSVRQFLTVCLLPSVTAECLQLWSVQAYDTCAQSISITSRLSVRSSKMTWWLSLSTVCCGQLMTAARREPWNELQSFSAIFKLLLGMQGGYRFSCVAHDGHGFNPDQNNYQLPFLIPKWLNGFMQIFTFHQPLLCIALNSNCYTTQ